MSGRVKKIQKRISLVWPTPWTSQGFSGLRSSKPHGVVDGHFFQGEGSLQSLNRLVPTQKKNAGSNAPVISRFPPTAGLPIFRITRSFRIARLPENPRLRLYTFPLVNLGKVFGPCTNPWQQCLLRSRQFLLCGDR